ncbi:MAG: hypothetical protein B7Z66_10220 [Chromatiales bacterium 21-64-14]|nr:MAG: hypothetical protein B7Z66_10220 [Chromatiales bacterium 21-64-14]
MGLGQNSIRGGHVSDHHGRRRRWHGESQGVVEGRHRIDPIDLKLIRQGLHQDLGRYHVGGGRDPGIDTGRSAAVQAPVRGIRGQGLRDLVLAGGHPADLEGLLSTLDQLRYRLVGSQHAGHVQRGHRSGNGVRDLGGIQAEIQRLQDALTRLGQVGSRQATRQSLGGPHNKGSDGVEVGSALVRGHCSGHQGESRRRLTHHVGAAEGGDPDRVDGSGRNSNGIFGGGIAERLGRMCARGVGHRDGRALHRSVPDATADLGGGQGGSGAGAATTGYAGGC